MAKKPTEPPKAHEAKAANTPNAPKDSWKRYATRDRLGSNVGEPKSST